MDDDVISYYSSSFIHHLFKPLFIHEQLPPSIINQASSIVTTTTWSSFDLPYYVWLGPRIPWILIIGSNWSDQVQATVAPPTSTSLPEFWPSSLSLVSEIRREAPASFRQTGKSQYGDQSFLGFYFMFTVFSMYPVFSICTSLCIAWHDNNNNIISWILSNMNILYNNNMFYITW